MQWSHWWCCKHYVIWMPAPMVSWLKKSCCTSFQFSWCKKWNGYIENAIGIMWSEWMPVPMVPHGQKCHRTSSFWSSWPKKCNGTTDHAVSIPWCWHQWQWHHVTPMPMASHDQKRYVAPDFSCLMLRNAMIPLMMLLESFDTDTWASYIKWQKVKLHLISIAST